MIEKSGFEVMVPKGYELIVQACEDALYRAAEGKGRKRHAEYDNQPLKEQDIWNYSHGWRLDQIVKKTKEVFRMKKRDQLGELTDVIVLAAVEIAKIKDEMARDIARKH